MKKGAIDFTELKHLLKWMDREQSTIDIEEFGHYRLGLTFDEIRMYLGILAKTTNKKKLANLYSRFWQIAGQGNTIASGPQNQALMYRHDVKRFCKSLFERKEAYFD